MQWNGISAEDNPLIDYPDEKEMFENETVDDVEVTSASLIDEKSKGESGEAQEHVSFECSDHEEQWFKTDEEQYWWVMFLRWNYWHVKKRR